MHHFLINSINHTISDSSCNLRSVKFSLSWNKVLELWDRYRGTRGFVFGHCSLTSEISAINCWKNVIDSGNQRLSCCVATLTSAKPHSGIVLNVSLPALPSFKRGSILVELFEQNKLVQVEVLGNMIRITGSCTHPADASLLLEAQYSKHKHILPLRLPAATFSYVHSSKSQLVKPVAKVQYLLVQSAMFFNAGCNI